MSSFGEKTFHHIHCVCHTKNANCFIMSFVWSCALAGSSHTFTSCIMCVHIQLLNPTPWYKYYPLLSDLGTWKLHFLGSICLGKNVHVVSQTERTCLQIPCTREAPFSSLLSSNGCCLPWQDILGLEVDGMDQAVAYWQIYMYTIVRPRDGMRACKNTVRCPDDCPFQVSSLWRSRKVQEEDPNPRDPQTLLLVRPETSSCRVVQIPSRPRRR